MPKFVCPAGEIDASPTKPASQKGGQKYSSNILHGNFGHDERSEILFDESEAGNGRLQLMNKSNLIKQRDKRSELWKSGTHRNSITAAEACRRLQAIIWRQ